MLPMTTRQFNRAVHAAARFSQFEKIRLLEGGF
jgi:hypothetical protein